MCLRWLFAVEKKIERRPRLAVFEGVFVLMDDMSYHISLLSHIKKQLTRVAALVSPRR